ncbi:MAG: HAD family phosphatase [Phycisphaeraceae bacterium]|nr:HAD family phosphatase [Phycisphaerales bacterium]QOJ17419.1 MAG: HAD family phosphatase [Phycisphaeraceae bacterium]
MVNVVGNTGPIRVACFDLGGVLIRICRTWAEGCARVGLPVRDPQRREETVQERQQVVYDYQTGRIDGPTFAQRLSEILRGAYTPEEVMNVHRAWVIEEYQGVAEALDRLKQAGLRTACLSNTNDAHWRGLWDYPVMNRLDVPLASHLLGLHKPDHAIYRAAEARFGAKGSSVLFFDDLEPNVAAAREVGWDAVHVNHAGRTDEQILAAARTRGIAV